MELMTVHIDKIEDLLGKMDEIIDTARSAPFSSKISIEKEVLFSVIDEIRAVAYDMRKGLPSELNQARRVLSDKDSHLTEARSKAEMIIKAAQAEAGKMISEHEITVQAKLAASEIADEANRETNNFKISAAQYVDGIFSDLDHLLKGILTDHMQKSKEAEDFYRNILDELYQNRREIRISDE